MAAAALLNFACREMRQEEKIYYILRMYKD